MDKKGKFRPLNDDYATEAKQDDIITATQANSLTIINAIDSATYNLYAVAFSVTTDILSDYILDNIEFNFSTAESKTITITSSDGTKIWEDTNTDQHVFLSNIDIAFNGGENITVAVTQFSSAGTMDCILKVKQGSGGGLSADPVLGAGTNLIGGVKLSDENGTLYGVKHVENKPRVSSMDYLYDIAEGNITAHTPYAKLGYNGDVGATEEEIITQGGSYYWIPTATALEVVSSSTDDDVAGIGVQKVKVTYLNADYSEASEILDMDGQTQVPLTDTTILRVNSIRATQVGTNLMSVGTINCRTVVGGNIVRSIATGFTRGRGLTYTVPLGKTLYLTSIAVSSGYTTAGKVVRWIGRAKVDDSAPTVKIDFFQPFFEVITQDASFHRNFEMPVKIPATADLKVSATSNGAGSFCSCSLRGWME